MVKIKLGYMIRGAIRTEEYNEYEKFQESCNNK